MTEEELMRALIDHVNANDKDNQLDPEGHYAFAISGFVRPDNPDEWLECNNTADRMASVAAVHFTAGTASEEGKPIEQLCALAAQSLNCTYSEEMIKQAQLAVRKRAELFND